MGLTWGFGFAFLKRTSISLTDTVVWNTSFLDCTDTSLLWSLMVAPGPGAEGQLSHMMEHSQVGCPAIHRLSWPWLCVHDEQRLEKHFVPLVTPMLCPALWGILCAVTAVEALEKPHRCDCKPCDRNKRPGTALVQKLWHLLQSCFFPFSSTGWQHQI